MKFYCTFGNGHPNRNCYIVIEAHNVVDAGLKMHERFGKQWSMIYDSAEAAGVEQWGLKEIK